MIICQNKIFSEIIDKQKDNNYIEIIDGMTAEVFLLLEKYYGGGSFEITNENVFDLLIACLKYNEYGFIKEICDYIKENIDDKLSCKLFEKSSLLLKAKLTELSDMSNEYFKKNCYRFINRSI